MGTATLHLQRELHTDVLHVDLAEPPAGTTICAVEVGHLVGFEGKIIARIGEDGTFYGVTVLNFSSVKRTLIWQYRVLSWRRALDLVVSSIRAGMATAIEQQHCLHPV